MRIASLPGMKERTVCGQRFFQGLCHDRLAAGLCLRPGADACKAMTKIHQSAIMCAPTTSQYAAIDGSAPLRRGYRGHAQTSMTCAAGFWCSSLNRMGLACFEPEGAFYVFPSIRITGLSSEDFCEKLLFGKKVAVVPGNAFGDSGEGHVRITYSYSIDHLVRGAGPHRAVFAGAGRVSDGEGSTLLFRAGLRRPRRWPRPWRTFFAQSAAARALGPRSRVLVKPNLVAKHAPEKAVTTHPAVLDAVCAALRRRGVESITVADSPGGLYNPAVMKSIYKASGLLAVCERHGALAYTACEAAPA